MALDATEDRARVRVLPEQRLAALNAQIDVPEHVRASLRQLARECTGGASEPCPILLSFEHAGR